MSKIFVIFFFMILTLNQIEAQNDCEIKKMVLKSILQDSSIQNLVKNKKSISVYWPFWNFCNHQKDTVFRIDDKTINLNFKKNQSEELKENEIHFVYYRSLKKVIYAELLLFNKNAHYSIVLKRENDSLKRIDSGMYFIKSK